MQFSQSSIIYTCIVEYLCVYSQNTHHQHIHIKKKKTTHKRVKTEANTHENEKRTEHSEACPMGKPNKIYKIKTKKLF